MKVADYISEGRARLAAAGLECADPQLHMKQILEFVLGWTLSDVVLRSENELSPAEVDKLESFLRRRLTGEPFQYIAGEEWFWKSRFSVGPGVLIPRRETELITEHLLKRVPQTSAKVAELGPGSGNIGLTMLQEKPDWKWHAFELNPETLPYLKENRRVLLPAEAKYHIHAEDFFTGAPKFAPYDLLVSNPPYVASQDWPTLSKEVRSEPRLALDGGAQGIEILSRLLAEAVSLLKPSGVFVSEIGSDQRELAVEVAARFPFAAIEVLSDYAGLPRVLWAVRR